MATILFMNSAIRSCVSRHCTVRIGSEQISSSSRTAGWRSITIGVNAMFKGGWLAGLTGDETFGVCFALGQFEVVLDHDLGEFFQVRGGLPA